MAKVVIAGGTGMIGQQIEKQLLAKGHDVFILTRSPKKNNHISWDPKKKTLDVSKINGTNCLINLSGETISGKRWSNTRKSELHDSRIGTNTFLYSKFNQVRSLNLFISASGINCYPLLPKNKIWQEHEAFGTDYLSNLVKEWEKSADLFAHIVPVSKIRISMVLDNNGGALKKLLPLAKMGILSPMGDGNQPMNWIHINDVANAFVFAFENNLDGAFNLTGQQITNTDFTKGLLTSQGKKLIFPKIPAFLMKLVLGEQSTIVLDGVKCDNSLLKEKSFEYQFEDLSNALANLFPKN